MARSRSRKLLRTTDLTLAALLIMNGHTPDLERSAGEVRPGHPQGSWLFEETDNVRTLVEHYQNDEARVEPQQFYQVVNTTRRKMFKHLGIGQGTQQ